LPNMVLQKSHDVLYTANAIREVFPMKTSNIIPSLWIGPKLRQAAESVMNEGESLSAFMEESLRVNITRRLMQREFIARSLAARDNARETERYIDTKEVLACLQAESDAAMRRKEGCP
jgi:hypothetical protein